MVLPDCMMPDGGEACLAYHELTQELARLRAENERLRALLETNSPYGKLTSSNTAAPSREE